jgi:uncharacterized iron-regulated protein
MKTLLFSSLFLVTHCLFAQSPQAFEIYNSKGKQVAYEKMLKDVSRADVVFFGELHDNSINHWLELQVTKGLYAEHGKDLVVAMEMFEADDQLVLDEFMSGLIEERHLLKEAKMWDNYKTDYKPIVEFAKEHQLKVVASNIPRRYANLVYRKGPDALNNLPDEAKKYIAPLPLEIDLNLPGYQEMIESMGGHGAPGSAENLASSQASKDATMGWFISKESKSKVIHFNGSYHSKNGEGIIWYLNKYKRKASVATIHCVEQENIGELAEGNVGAADFIIVIPSDMTKTY